MIEDQELRALFAAESEEHLQNLEKGLLHLEKHPDDMGVLKDLFREAHSLKGAARMLGVSDVEALAHHFEDVLGAASKGQKRFVVGEVDRLAGGLDDIRALSEEAVTGKKASVTLADAFQRLTVSSISLPPPLSPPLPKDEVGAKAPPPISPGEKLEKDFSRAEKEKEASLSENTDPFSMEEEATPVIRVRSNKLDALLKRVGELTVVRTRVKRRLNEIEALIVAWEGHQRGGATVGSVTEEASVDVGLRHESFGNRLHALRDGIFEDEASLALVADALEEGIRNLRLLPLSTLFGRFPRLVRDLARQQDKEVVLLTEGGETTADKRILEEMKSPLMHLIRNAVDHGLENTSVREAAGKPREGCLTLRAFQTAKHVVFSVRDDGRGLDLEAIRRQAHRRGLVSEEMLGTLTQEQLYALTFQSGFSTSAMVTDVSGRGVGLDAVRANVERLKGRVHVTSEPGKGCCFTIHLPITLATTPVFIVSASGSLFAIPLDSVHSVRRVSPKDIFSIEGCETIVLDHKPVSVARLAHLLELEPPHTTEPPPPWPCIILSVNMSMGSHEGDDGFLGVMVDTLDDELEILLKPYGGILQRVRNVAGVTILGSGDVCMVVNPRDLLLTVRKQGQQGQRVVGSGMTEAKPSGPNAQAGQRKKTVLLVEDSITTRTQEKRILQSAGYEVMAAVDGLDALNQLGKQPIDALVSDVQMPNLDGLALAKKIRENPIYKDLPIILVTSLSSDADMQRGMEVGANAYITKPTFEQKVFLETLRRLV